MACKLAAAVVTDIITDVVQGLKKTSLANGLRNLMHWQHTHAMRM
jgi:hypothetical protein